MSVRDIECETYLITDKSQNYSLKNLEIKRKIIIQIEMLRSGLAVPDLGQSKKKKKKNGLNI